MDNDDTRRILQAARALLRWDVPRFAAGVGVGAVTIRRIEAGIGVKPETVEAVLSKLEGIGIHVVENGADGVVLGVGLLPHASVGPPPLASAHKREGSRQKAPPRPRTEKKKVKAEDDVVED